MLTHKVLIIEYYSAYQVYYLLYTRYDSLNNEVVNNL